MTNNKSFSNTRKSSFNLDKLRQKIEKSKTKGKDREDNNFWKITVDKADAGEATIRLLPGLDGEMYIEHYFHYFKGAGGTLWEACPNTVGKPCPVCASNSELYKLNTPDAKTMAGQRKKQHKYISNILVVDDKGNPENNGKVFLFEYGPDLYARFIANMDGDDEDPKFNRVVPFALDETGADFKLVSHHEKGYRKYTKSFYKKPSVSKITDEQLETQKNLQEVLEGITKKVKSDSELQSRMDKVLKKTPASAGPSVEEEEDEDQIQETSASDDISLGDDIDDEIAKLIG